MSHRGEFFWKENYKELDVRHLFYGREISVGSKFYLVGVNHKYQENIIVSIQPDSPNKLDEKLDDLGKFNYDRKEILFDNSGEISDEIDESEDIVFVLDWKRREDSISGTITYKLSPDGGIRMSRSSRKATKLATKSQFITPLSLDIDEITQLFD